MGNWNIKKRIAITVSVCLIFIITVGAIAIWSMQKQGKSYNHLLANTIEYKNYLEEIKISMLMMRRSEKDYLLRGKDKYVTRAHKQLEIQEGIGTKIAALDLTIADKEIIAEIKKTIVGYRENFNNAVKNIKEMGTSKTGVGGKMRSIAHNIEGRIKSDSLDLKYMIKLLMFRRYEKDFLLRKDKKYLVKAEKLQAEFISTMRSDKLPDEILNYLKQEVNNYVNEMKTLVSLEFGRANFISQARNHVHKMETGINKYLDNAKKQVHHTIDTNNKLSEIIFSVNVGLVLAALVISGIFVFWLFAYVKNIVSKININISSLTENIEQISKGNIDLSARTQEQASSLEETASTMEEITSTVKQNTESTGKATQLTESAVLEVTSGSEGSQKTQKAMDGISDSSEKISSIVSMVNEIAFQTNILAINAAIEAAKAGELGKGFAVVAIEVRDLAQRAAGAAKEIKDLIDISIERVDNGTQLVNKNYENLKSISISIKKTSDIVGEIASASKEQFSAIEQVNLAITQIDSNTQHNSSLVEELASSSKAMEDNANIMVQFINESLGKQNVDEEDKLIRIKNLFSFKKSA